MNPYFRINAGELDPRLEAALVDGAGNLVFLSGASVTFTLYGLGGVEIFTRPAVVVSNNGRVRYDWATGETGRFSGAEAIPVIEAGKYLAKFNVTYEDDVEQSFPDDRYIEISIAALYSTTRIPSTVETAVGFPSSTVLYLQRHAGVLTVRPGNPDDPPYPTLADPLLPPGVEAWDETLGYDVACMGIPDGLVHIARAEPTVTEVGTVVFFSVGGGENWVFGNAETSAWQLQMRSLGWRVMAVRWGDGVGSGEGWSDNSSPTTIGGPARMAGRGAGVIQFIHDTYAGIGEYALAGVSGGSSLCCYALTTYGLSSIVDKVIVGSGPPHASIYLGCATPIDSIYAYNEAGNDDNIDDSYGLNEYACSRHTLAGNPVGITIRGAAWAEDGVLAGSDLRFDQDVVTHFIYGPEDTSVAVAQGKLLLAQQPEALVSYPPETGHSIWNTANSRQTIVDVLRGAPTIRQGSMENVTGGNSLSFPVGYDATTRPHEDPIKAGSLLVLEVRSDDVLSLPTSDGATTPWVLAASQGTATGLGLLRLYWKVANGTETSVNLASTSGFLQAGFFEIQQRGVTNWAVDVSDTSTSGLTAVTSLEVGPVTPGSAVGWAHAVVSGGNVTFNQAWTGGFVPLGVSSRMSSAGYAFMSTAPLSTTEFCNSTRAIGVLACWVPA